MSKGKAAFQQIFLYLLLILSAAFTACSAILYRSSSAAVNCKEFIDTAVASVDQAYALLEQQSRYQSMLIGGSIATAVCILLLALWYIVHGKRKKRRTAFEQQSGQGTQQPWQDFPPRGDLQ